MAAIVCGSPWFAPPGKLHKIARLNRGNARRWRGAAASLSSARDALPARGMGEASDRMTRRVVRRDGTSTHVRNSRTASIEHLRKHARQEDTGEPAAHAALTGGFHKQKTEEDVRVSARLRVTAEQHESARQMVMHTFDDRRLELGNQLDRGMGRATKLFGLFPQFHRNEMPHERRRAARFEDAAPGIGVAESAVILRKKRSFGGKDRRWRIGWRCQVQTRSSPRSSSALMRESSTGYRRSSPVTAPASSPRRHCRRRHLSRRATRDDRSPICGPYQLHTSPAALAPRGSDVEPGTSAGGDRYGRCNPTGAQMSARQRRPRGRVTLKCS